MIVLVLLAVGAGFYYFGWPKVQAMIERSHRTQCASNLHDISVALIEYDVKFDAYPPDLLTLWKWKPTLKGSIFVCPSSDDTPAADPSQLMSGNHLSFMYLKPSNPAPGMGPPADFVVLYDKPDNHMEAGMNLGFGDGRVEWKNSKEATALITNTTRKTPPATNPTAGVKK